MPSSWSSFRYVKLGFHADITDYPQGLLEKMQSDFADVVKLLADDPAISAAWDTLCELSKKPEQSEGLDATETKNKSDKFTFALTMSLKNLAAQVGITKSTQAQIITTLEAEICAD
jgi:trimethylamine:corrinoid methyltransferase-like protein